MRSGSEQARGRPPHAHPGARPRQGLKAQRAAEVFPAVVGEQISAHAWAEGVRGDTLLVVTDSPVWSHQLQMLEPELVGKLREALGGDCPRQAASIPVRVQAPRVGSGAPGTGGGERVSPTAARRRISRAQWAEIRSVAGQARDGELARALSRALRAQIGPCGDMCGEALASGDAPPGTSSLTTPKPPGRPTLRHLPCACYNCHRYCRPCSRYDTGGGPA